MVVSVTFFNFLHIKVISFGNIVVAFYYSKKGGFGEKDEPPKSEMASDYQIKPESW